MAEKPSYVRQLAMSEGEPTPENEKCCSFCSKTVDEVRKLITGPQVSICDECVDLCNDIIAEDSSATEGATVETRTTTFPVICVVCRLAAEPLGYIEVPSRGVLCNACVEVIRIALDSSLADEPDPEKA